MFSTFRARSVPKSRFIFQRNLSAPLDRYMPLSTPASVFWTTAVPTPAKYFSALISVSVGLVHLHPNTIGTLGPPVAIGGYMLYRRLQHKQYLRSLGLVFPERDTGGEELVVKAYDEASLENAASGIENEFDNFKSQTLSWIERRLVDHVIDQGRTDSISPTLSKLLENNQVIVHLDDSPETFVTSKADVGEEHFPTFVSMSVPMYSSKNRKNRQRLGSIEVSLLESETTEEKTTYKVGMQLWPYQIFSKPERII